MRTAIYSSSLLSTLIFRIRLSEVRVFSTRNSDVMYFRHSSASVTKLLIFRTPEFRNGSLFAFSVGVLSSFTYNTLSVLADILECLLPANLSVQTFVL